MQPSVTRSLPRSAGIGHYPQVSAVAATAQALRCEPSTAAQFLKPADPACPFTRSAMIAEALYANGHGARADALLLPLDLVRQAHTITDATPDAFAAAMETEATVEGRENVAQIFVRDAASYSTWRRQAVAEITATLRAIRIGDAVHGRA